MSEVTKAHTIISYYKTKYKEKYDRPPIVNRNKVQYLVANVLKDLGIQQVKDLIDFYIETDRNPTLADFCYEYDDILVRMETEAKDLENRKNLLSETQKRVEEFRRRYGAAE